MVERTEKFLNYSGLCKLVEEINAKYALKTETIIPDNETIVINDDGKAETKYKTEKISYDDYIAKVEAGTTDEFTFYYIDEGADTPLIRIGTTDISDVGDGTITGAIKELHDLFSLDKALSPTSAKGVENRVITNHFENYYQKDEVPVTLGMIFNSDHELTVQIKNSRGEVLSEQTKNLMIESVVVGGSFNESTGTLLLELSKGSPIEIPISSLVSGLVDSNTKIAGIDLRDDITSQELTSALKPVTISSQGMMSASDKTKLDQLNITEIEDAIQSVNDIEAIPKDAIYGLFD